MDKIHPVTSQHYLPAHRDLLLSSQNGLCKLFTLPLEQQSHLASTGHTEAMEKGATDLAPIANTYPELSYLCSWLPRLAPLAGLLSTEWAPKSWKYNVHCPAWDGLFLVHAYLLVEGPWSWEINGIIPQSLATTLPEDHKQVKDHVTFVLDPATVTKHLEQARQGVVAHVWLK